MLFITIKKCEPINLNLVVLIACRNYDNIST
jgi:hypothetical protein